MARIPRLSKASAHAEVAQRYREMAKRQAKRHPQSKSRTFAALRIRELTVLYEHLWPRGIPAGDIGYQAARVMVHHIARLRHADRRMDGWLGYCVPWIDLGDRETIMREAVECRLKWRADKLAWKFGVTDTMRTELKLTTIGAIDVSKAERLKRRKEQNNNQMRAKRRDNGVKSRPEYLKAIKLTSPPWVVAGCSRATWYRRQRET